MLPQWNPDSLRSKIPGINLALVGGRRMGKSTATAALLWRWSDKFDLVLCFVGSANCNPVLQSLLARYWDPRFFFSEWSEPMIKKLLQQQERLEKKRSVLILVDDVVMNSKAQDQLSTIAMRGRHFHISLCIAAVSYTTLPKRVRRSLDAVLVFSLPMKGDLKILTWEYTNNTRVAEFALHRLQEHECLVLETLTRKQRLAVWKADYFSDRDVRTLESPGSNVSQTMASPEKSSGRPSRDRRDSTSSSPDRTQSPEDHELISEKNEDVCLP